MQTRHIPGLEPHVSWFLIIENIPRLKTQLVDETATVRQTWLDVVKWNSKIVAEVFNCLFCSTTLQLSWRETQVYTPQTSPVVPVRHPTRCGFASAAPCTLQCFPNRVSNPGTISNPGISGLESANPGITGLIPGLGVSKKSANLLAHKFLQAVFLSVTWSLPLPCGQLWFDYWIDRLWSQVSTLDTFWRIPSYSSTPVLYFLYLRILSWYSDAVVNRKLRSYSWWLFSKLVVIK